MERNSDARFFDIYCAGQPIIQIDDGRVVVEDVFGVSVSYGQPSICLEWSFFGEMIELPEIVRRLNYPNTMPDKDVLREMPLPRGISGGRQLESSIIVDLGNHW